MASQVEKAIPEKEDFGNHLPASGLCTITVTFTPSARGARGAAVTISASADGSPQTVPLSGTGTQGLVVLFPPNLDFRNQTVGITSAPQESTLTNTGDGTLTITSMAVTGPNSGDFAEKDNCGASVPAGGSCYQRDLYPRGYQQPKRSSFHHR